MINLFVDSIYKRHQTHVTGLNTDFVQIHQIIKVYRYYLLWGKSSLNYLKKNRFVRWEDENGLQYEEQAGYIKGYNTIDYMFTLQSLVQKYISKEKGRYCVLFIDFSKAFDMIPHSLLWYTLKGLADAKIIKKSVILFRVLNMTIWCKHVHRLELQIFKNFVLRIHQLD